MYYLYDYYAKPNYIDNIKGSKTSPCNHAVCRIRDTYFDYEETIDINSYIFYHSIGLRDIKRTIKLTNWNKTFNRCHYEKIIEKRLFKSFKIKLYQ